MDERLRQTVRERADHRCEYCYLPQNAEPFFAYHVDTSFIVARQHDGTSDSENLALACYHCNTHKGPNLSGLDPETGALVRLFHPRQDRWDEHFERNGVLIGGRSAVGTKTCYRGSLLLQETDGHRAVCLLFTCGDLNHMRTGPEVLQVNVART